MKHPRFYTRLAFSSLKRNMSSWLPYLLSVTGTVTMYVIMLALSSSPTLTGVYGGRTIQKTLSMGVMVAEVFAVIFILYTHSFLLKRRRQEFGLFTVLGLEKRHLGRVLAIETLATAAVSTVLGLLMGALLCKLMYLIVLSMLGAPPDTALSIPGAVYLRAALEFFIIHALTLLITLRQVHTHNPIELLKGGAQGEKPMKNHKFLALLGIVLLGTGYYLSLSVRDALSSIGTFFLAVLLVILGTYALFLWGSVAGLKNLQSNKKFYYQAKHFPVVAGMVHRIKRNAVGLATICILSTMVLVMVAATGSLFLGRENVLYSRGREARFIFSPMREEAIPRMWDIVHQEADKLNIPLTKEIGYRSIQIPMEGTPDALSYQATGEYWQSTFFTMVPWEDFSAIHPEEAAPAPGEALYFSAYGKDLPEALSLVGMPLRMAKRLSAINPLDEDRNYLLTGNYTLIMLEQDLQTLYAQAPDAFATEHRYTIAFNTGYLDTQDAWPLVDNIQNSMAKDLLDENTGGFTTYGTHVAVERADFNALYGGLLFVAVFLGALFIMALVLIIYYKQVSEGYEDRQGFHIMRKVGMSDEEVKAAIKSQVLLVFFLPLLMAGLHMLAAFNITVKVLQILMLTNAGLFALVSVRVFLLFALFYLAVYAKTTRSYYKVVNSAA